MPNASPEPGLPDTGNPSGLDGIEFIEYATARPLALGHALELMGFRPVARHRSREVLLYRQGTMNVVINAHHRAEPHPGLPDEVRISAVAFRTRDAAAACRYTLERGAWAVPTHVEVMELNIPAIHGAGASRIYFVDRYREFSIYTVDFVPIPCVEQQPPAIAGMRWFGLVQYVGPGRLNDWTEFYRELFAFRPVPDDRHVDLEPGRRILCSPCRSFHLQLLEPARDVADPHVEERLARICLGTDDVTGAARTLRGRGVEFMEPEVARADERGVRTRGLLAGVAFELVRAPRTPPSAP